MLWSQMAWTFDPFTELVLIELHARLHPISGAPHLGMRSAPRR